MSTNEAGVAAAADAILGQCAAFVEVVTDEAYTAEAETIKGGTIGKHVRHCLDHFRAALEADETGAPIDYDHRQREVPSETDRRAALEGIGALRRRLEIMSGAEMRGKTRVRIMLSADGDEAELESTVGREVAFATHHAVHHNAMIKAIASEFGVRASRDFGTAPSTLNYERARAGGA